MDLRNIFITDRVSPVFPQKVMGDGGARKPSTNNGTSHRLFKQSAATETRIQKRKKRREFRVGSLGSHSKFS